MFFSNIPCNPLYFCTTFTNLVLRCFEWWFLNVFFKKKSKNCCISCIIARLVWILFHIVLNDEFWWFFKFSFFLIFPLYSVVFLHHFDNPLFVLFWVMMFECLNLWNMSLSFPSLLHGTTCLNLHSRWFELFLDCFHFLNFELVGKLVYFPVFLQWFVWILLQMVWMIIFDEFWFVLQKFHCITL